MQKHSSDTNYNTTQLNINFTLNFNGNWGRLQEPGGGV